MILASFLSDIIGDFAEDSLTRDYILLKNLNESITEKGIPPEYAYVSRINEFFYAMESKRTIESFSSFYRAAIRKLSRALQEHNSANSQLENIIEAYIITAIDCIPGKLPTDIRIYLPRTHDDEILIFPSKDRTVRAGDINHRSIEVLYHLLKVPSQKNLSFPVLKSKRPVLFTGKSRHFYDKSYIDEISLPTENYKSLLTCMRNAFGLIQQVHPSKLDHIISTIECIVPVNFENKDVHRSFSDSTLPGVIFLSQNATAIEMAEAIIHECGHNYLNAILQTIDLSSGAEPSRLFYSPWRQDPRPLGGLFHAIFVFTEVCIFYHSLLEMNILGSTDSTTVAFNLDKNYSRIRKALPQLKKDLLTPEAWEIVKLIKAELKSLTLPPVMHE